jgi:hypothetical protein
MPLTERADERREPSIADPANDTLNLMSYGADWWNNACIGYAESEWSLYARGYERAADILVRHVEHRASDRDTIVYPIIFLYRQYFELRLKHINRDACALIGAEFKVPNSHRLTPLFANLKAQLVTVASEFGGDTPDSAELDRASAVFRALDDIDPKSMTFRYPEDLNANRTLPDIRHINVRHFRDTIESTSTLLEGIDCQLAVLDDLKNDWLGSM